jgi:arylsulfatase A-like enzyme/Flp pilus assembly protein TadD
MLREVRAMRRWLALLLGAILVGGCGKGEMVPPPPPIEAPWSWQENLPEGNWNLLLVTLDTTRRDALGCYGKPEAGTATLDSLARSGVLFDDAVSPVPITCPAHATLLTGLDPGEHGVRDNGRFRAADSLLTLAEVLQQAGYTTAAFVSAFPLDHQFGLDQGFGLYDDTFRERAVARSRETSQRRADATTDAVLAWSRGGIPRPFFLWVHYFDPHFPYDPPDPFGNRFRKDPYQGEVAFMDHHLGRLLRGLRERGLLDSTFVLVVGDHGESLGEHGEDSHSFFIYEATQRVPCLLVAPPAWPLREALPDRFGATVRMRDLAPTLANLLGREPGPWRATRSASLVPALLEGDAPPVEVVYLETLVPQLEYGWSDLRGVRTSRWKFIRAPRPELYDLREDPAESHNLYGKRPEVSDRLRAWLEWYLAPESGATPQPISPEVAERLRSLGYLQGPGAGPGQGSGADPKDRITAYKAIMDARTLAARYEPERAIPLLERVAAEEPRNLEIRRLLASTYAMARRLEKAMELYRDLVAEAPDEWRYVEEAVRVALLQGDTAWARRTWDEAATRDPDRAGLWLLRAEIAEARGDTAAALAACREEIRRHPEEAAAAWTRLGSLLRLRGRSEEARRALRSALALDPGQASALAELAELAFAQGDTARGDSLMLAALSLDPFEPQANFRKGLRASEADDLYEARQAYERAVRAQPEFAAAHVNLGNVYLKTGQPGAALREYETALALGYDSVTLRTNLGVAYAQSGRLAEAREAWTRALEMGPDPATAEGLRRNLELLRQAMGGRP